MTTCGDKAKDLREHDYIGISEISCMEGSGVSSAKEMVHKKTMLNLKETELRLGLPGSNSPDRTELCLMGPSKTEENAQMFVSPFKSFGSGAKRFFLDTVDLGGDLTISTKPALQDAFGTKSGVKPNWHANGGADHMQSSFNSSRAICVGKSSAAKDCSQTCVSSMPIKEVAAKERHHQSKPRADDPLVAPVAKAQVVGWPPIRSYMKNTMATNPTKVNAEASMKPSSQCLYVKVSMDGAPYLRKIDLRNYHTYQELSAALEKMFICFTLGQCGPHAGSGRDGLSESRLEDLLHGAEYVLTYEDKDGDWMLVGDVPWGMFTGSCKRLRIMKGSEAIGLAPRAMEKCKD